MHRTTQFTTLTIALLAAGCGAHAAMPLRVRYAELGHGAKIEGASGPIVIEFRPGDRLPVELRFDGESFEMSPAAPSIELVAKSRCFVRIDRDGIRTSLDGVSFDERPKVPGRFQLGFSATSAGAKLVVAVATPRYGEAH